MKRGLLFSSLLAFGTGCGEGEPPGEAEGTVSGRHLAVESAVFMRKTEPTQSFSTVILSSRGGDLCERLKTKSLGDGEMLATFRLGEWLDGNGLRRTSRGEHAVHPPGHAEAPDVHSLVALVRFDIFSKGCPQEGESRIGVDGKVQVDRTQSFEGGVSTGSFDVTFGTPDGASPEVLRGTFAALWCVSDPPPTNCTK